MFPNFLDRKYEVKISSTNQKKSAKWLRFLHKLHMPVLKFTKMIRGKMSWWPTKNTWISTYFQVFVKIWVNLYSKQTDLPGVSSALTRIHIPTKTVWIVAAIVSVKSDTTSFWGKCMSLHIQCSTIMYIWCNTCKWRPNACTAELLCVYLICAVY